MGGVANGRAQDNKRKHVWVSSNIHKSYYTWRVIATNYLWFLEFITSFVYPMINTLVFSWMLTWIAVNLDYKKITAKNFIMRSKKLYKRKIITVNFINFVFFFKPKDKNKSNMKIIQVSLRNTFCSSEN